MATLLATQNGNIDDPLTWGGTIPSNMDILDAKNYVINVNTNSSYSRLINTDGGYFNLLDGVSLSAEILNTQTLNFSGYCVLYEGTASASITGKIKGGNLLDRYGVYINNNNHLIINGPVVAGFKSGTNNGGIGVKSSVTAGGSLIVNGDIGIEGTFTNPSSARGEFSAINTEALSSIIINGNIDIPNSTSVEGLKGLVVKIPSTSTFNPKVEINGNISVFDNHGYGTTTFLGALDYRGRSSTSVTSGSVKINGVINAGSNTYYHAALISGKTDVNVTGNIIAGSSNCRALAIVNNNNAVVTLSTNLPLFAGAVNASSDWAPVQIQSSNNLTISIFGNIESTFLRVGSTDSSGLAVTNSVLNIEGNIKNSNTAGGGHNIKTEDYCIGLTINVVGSIYGGSTGNAINMRALNRTSNLALNVFAYEIVGGITSSAIVTDAYDQPIYFDINAQEISAHPLGGTGHAISAISRYTGSFKVNAKRILDSFTGVTALFVRAYDLSDIPQDAIIRYAAAPYAGFGPYVIHSTINSLSTFQMPPPEAVRDGVIYAGGSLTGACRIPSVSSVLLGTPVGAPDGDVGISTLDKSLLNYDALYNASLNAFDGPDTVGRKLRLCPTTEVIGEIIESFQIVH